MHSLRLAATILFLATVSIATACGPPRVDGTSDEVFRRSLEDVAAPLDTAERRRFDEAIVTITAFELGCAQAEGRGHRSLRHYLNGLTYEQVVALPRHLRGEHETTGCRSPTCPLAER